MTEKTVGEPEELHGRAEQDKSINPADTRTRPLASFNASTPGSFVSEDIARKINRRIAAVLRHKDLTYTWHPVTEGDSGASVFHLAGGAPELFLKVAPTTPDSPAFDLAQEFKRLEWLNQRGILVPRIVEFGSDESAAWLVTEPVQGVSAAERWPEHQRFTVVEAMADLARALHELPTQDCPFDRRMAVVISEARHNLRKGLVDLDELEEEYAGWTGEQLLVEVARTKPVQEDLVVCHGDFCPNNVLIDPGTCRIAGLIDVGRLGVADRYADLALAVRELKINEDPWFGPAYAERFIERYGIRHVDEGKMAFYRLLDEFF